MNETIPDDLQNIGLQCWIEALRDGTPEAGNIIARAIIAERKRCSKICRDMAAAYEADKVDGVQWQARAGELRWVAGLIDDTVPPPDVIRAIEEPKP